MGGKSQFPSCRSPVHTSPSNPLAPRGNILWSFESLLTMSNEEDVLLEALEKRLNNLETIVFGPDPVAAAHHSKTCRCVS